MLCVVAPLLHVMPEAIDEVRVTEFPWQIVVDPEGVITGKGLIFIANGPPGLPEHPIGALTLTESEVEDVSGAVV